MVMNVRQYWQLDLYSRGTNTVPKDVFFHSTHAVQISVSYISLKKNADGSKIVVMTEIKMGGKQSATWHNEK